MYRKVSAVEPLLNKFAAPQSATLETNRLLQRYFPVYLAKFLRTSPDGSFCMLNLYQYKFMVIALVKIHVYLIL